MPSIQYDEIYSRFYTKVMAYDLAELSASQSNELMCSWLHSAVFDPYIRRQFSNVSMDDKTNVISYTMSYTIDAESDKEYVTELLACGIAYSWVVQKVQNLTNLYQTFGSSDEKYYSQSAHLAELRNLRDDLKNTIRSMSRDRGYSNNTYLDGTSASASLRK